MSLPKSAVGLGSIVAGLVFLKVAAHYDVYTTPFMTLGEMWQSLPSGLKFTLASGYLLMLCGCTMLVIALVNRRKSKQV